MFRSVSGGEARFTALAEVRSYWEALRGPGGAAPPRSLIDPRGIAGALESCFLAERIAPGQARFRLAGMGLCDLMGMDLRGMPLTSLIDPASRTSFAAAVAPALAGTGPVTLVLEAERGLGRPALEGRMLLLPLADAAGRPGLALGCLATEGEIGRTPRRFVLAGARAEAAEGPAAPEPAPGFAPPAAGFAPLPRRAPHLRLVKG